MRFDLESRDRTYIIAEAGTCHADADPDRRFTKAQEYVAQAKHAGADAVKFQWFNNPIEDDFFCWIDGDNARQGRWEDSVMSFGDWRVVKNYADDLGIMLLASAFQHSTVEWLNKLEIPATKVASRAAKNFPYGNATGPFLISTGMPGYPLFIGPNDPRAIYLECEANYPSTTPWRDRFTGFSDHSGTPWRAIDAISRGCKLIELHFYIDPADAGPDLPASLTLEQLRLVCQARDGFAQIRKEAA